MSKTLCDLKSALKQDIRTYMELVSAPTHICRKCGRAANCKSLVCKPIKIEKAK